MSEDAKPETVSPQTEPAKKVSGKRSRTKGHSYERAIAIDLQKIGYEKARRQLEYHADDAKGYDIANCEPFFIQCKKMKKYAPLTKIQEVQCDRELGDIPVLVTAGDRQEDIVAMYWSDFLALLRKAKRAGLV